MKRITLFLLLAMIIGTAQAHKPSDSYLSLQTQGQEITGQWDIALRDLDYAIGLDSNSDGAIPWGELRHKHVEIAAYALSRLHIAADGNDCAMHTTRQLVDRHSDGAYSVLQFTAHCPVAPTTLGIDYHLFADLDPQHRGLLRLESAGNTRSAILGPAQDHQELRLATNGRLRQFIDYARTGIWHIWTGYDHILFLIALLLPSVLQHEAGRWRGVSDIRSAIMDTLKIVTAFTLAHSITLSLAVLDIVRLPSRLVESVIAASVVLAAINNLYPLIHRRRWLVAFPFGLMHGFGFAAVLIDLGLAPGALALSLAAFNVGVEAGQLAIVFVFLPLALLARDSGIYRRLVFTAGSWSVAGVAGVWLVQRAFNLQLVPG